MHIRALLLVGSILMLGGTPVMGQVEGDTLGLTGTMADTVVANRLFAEMKALIKGKKWEDSETKGNLAISIYIRFLGEYSQPVADLWHQMGFIKYCQGNYDKAELAWEKTLNIRLKVIGQEHTDVAKSYNNLGVIYRLKGENNKAIECYQKSLEIELKIYGPEHQDVASSYNNLGIAYKSNGEYDRAIIYYQKSLKIQLKVLGQEHANVALSYRNIGSLYSSIGEYDKSIEYNLKALEINLKNKDIIPTDIAYAYANLGTAYDSKGEHGKAIEYRLKLLEIRQKLWAEHPELASAYEDLGLSYNSIGEHNKAIEYCQKSLEIRLKTLGTNHPSVAWSYINLSDFHNSKGDYDKAIIYSTKALEIQSKTLDVQHRDMASPYFSLGSSYYLKSNNEKAIEYYQKALEIQLKTLGSEHPDLAHSYMGLGASHHSKKEYKTAIEYFRKALEIQLKIFGVKHPNIAWSYNGLGVTYEAIGKYDEAIDCFQKALMSCDFANGDYSKVNSLEQLIHGFNCLSITLKIKYNHEYTSKLLIQSNLYAIQTLYALNYQQTTFSEESSKSFWQTKNYPIYEQAISVSLLKADVDQNDTLRQNTFSYAEKSKASLLQAQIKAADAINFSGIPDSLLQKEHDLRIDLTWREKQRQALLNKGLSETDTNTLRISGIIFNLKLQYEALKKHLETEYPEYYRLKYDLSTVSLQYVQDTLLEPKNQALLEYFVGDSSIFLFVVRPDTMIVQEVKRDFPLEDWIEGLRQGLYGYYTADKALRSDSLRQATLAQYLEYAPKLYQKLIAPVAQLLPEKVILVPDGPLGYIPFDALLTGAPEDANNFKSYPYLIQKHQFSYTYSATLLREMRDKKHRQEPQKDFVAFAPFYNGDTTLLANMYAYDDLMRKDLQPLAFSGPEVAAASKLMHGETVAGAAATEERFTSTAGNYRIIHLATHGRADNRVGDYAFLAFTEIKDSIENELLYVKDLYNLQLNADLVVLSACETGIGKLQRGEGIISLARAFAYAGAKSIVTSLWSVNDKSTSELMRFFYRELQRGKDKDEALRLARLRFLKESSVRNGHPFFWAAFVPLGDMRPVR